MYGRVLLVCSANICRSPAAERLLAARLGRSVEVFSRGTHALPGARMCEVAATWALTQGADGGARHVSTQLTAHDVAAASLVLTASERHRAAVIELQPSAQVRTYTLRQAARIVGWRRAQGVRAPGPPGGARLPWLVDELDTYRSIAPMPVVAGRSASLLGRLVPDRRTTGTEASADSLADAHEGGRHADVLARLLEAVDDLGAAFTA